MQQGTASLRTPKTAQFPRQSQQYVMQPKTATFVKNDQRQHQQQMNLSGSSQSLNRSSPPQNVFVSRSPPQSHNLPRSPPKTNNGNVQNTSNVVTTASNKHQKSASSSSRPTP